MKDKRLLCIYTVLSLVTMLVACGDGDIPLWSQSSNEVRVTPMRLEAEPLTTPVTEENLPVTEKNPEGVYISEDEVINEQLDALVRNLQTPEYVNEGISMLFTQEWYDVLMPDGEALERLYYKATEDTVLYLAVGLEEQVQKYTDVWLQSGTEVMILQQTEDTIHQVFTQVEDGQYQGAFESWFCMATTGDVFHEKGMFEKGILIDDYVAEVRWGKAEADIMALWSMREDMEFETYEGAFAGDGVPIVRQLEVTEQKITNGCKGGENAVVYAYSPTGKSFLFLEKEDTGAASIFTNETLGIKNFPLSASENAYDEVIYEKRGAGEVVVATAPPMEVPTTTPSPTPTVSPTATPSPTPTVAPTESPSPTPTVAPAESPSPTPTVAPTEAPTASPAPTVSPTATPTEVPSPTPTEAPTATPSPTPTSKPDDPWGPDWLARRIITDRNRFLFRQ